MASAGIDLGVDAGQQSLEKSIEGYIRQMLNIFSNRLTHLQKSLQMRVLVPLFGRAQHARVEATFANESVESILIKAQGFYLREIERGGGDHAADMHGQLLLALQVSSWTQREPPPVTYIMG